MKTPTEAAAALRRAAFVALCGVLLSSTWSISLFVISSVALFVIGGTHLAVERRRPYPGESWQWALVAYVLVVGSTLLVSDYPYESFRGLLKVARQALLCVCAVWVLSHPGRLRRCALLWMGVAALTVADAWVQGLTGREPLLGRAMTPFHGDTLRWTGPYKHANDFSAFLTLAVFPFLSGALDRASRKGARTLCAVGALATLICLYQTYSRGAWIAVGVGVVVLAFLRRDRWMGAAIVAAALWAAFLSPELARERIHSLFDPAAGTVRERRLLWAEAAAMIAERPVLGWGVNTYAKNMPLFKPAGSAAPDYQYAHNGYLQIASETGLVGLVVFLAAVALCLARGYRALSHAPPSFERTMGQAYLAGACAFLVHSATDTNLQSILLVNSLWLALALLLACSRSAAAERP
ncbi:MAG: hypothetical protein MOGMAGMI_00871 [Candidatus Omnitrophica bacterium]|nr:hypothetical protein [Candidatus Omnitrophota bacterium]